MTLYDAGADKLSEAAYDLPADAGFCREKADTKAHSRFGGKIAVITGGAGNFGLACAERLLGEGADVALFDLRDASDKAKELEAKFEGRKVRAYSCDVTDEDVVNSTVAAVAKEFGKIDLLFNNAGYQGDFVKTHEYDVKNFRRVLDINVTGVFIVLKAVANQMMTQEPRGGSIVNTASMAGIGLPPNMLAYATSKAAVIHMTRISAKDLAPYDIRVNSVSPAFIGPGFMWSRQIELQAKADSIYYPKDPKEVAKGMVSSVPLKRYGSLAEVIGPVTFLLSDDASYLTGIDIRICGGD